MEVRLSQSSVCLFGQGVPPYSVILLCWESYFLGFTQILRRGQAKTDFLQLFFGTNSTFTLEQTTSWAGPYLLWAQRTCFLLFLGTQAKPMKL